VGILERNDHVVSNQNNQPGDTIGSKAIPFHICCHRKFTGIRNLVAAVIIHRTESPYLNFNSIYSNIVERERVSTNLTLKVIGVGNCDINLCAIRCSY